MEARLRSWLQFITKPWVAILVVAIVLVVAIAFIISAYRFGWTGTGFLNESLWDWLQLLIIPLALAVIALVFQLANSRTERQIAKERYEQDKEIASRHYHQDREIARQRYEQDQQLALDKQREDLLQIYLDRMSELLLEKNLRTSPPEAEVRNVARVRTTTVLTQLDARRIGYVFAFLREAELVSTQQNKNVVSFNDADFREVMWNQAYLNRANLNRANLNTASLYRTLLKGTNLTEAYLRRAEIGKAVLNKANLTRAHLEGADLSGADLSEAILEGANLSGAKVTEEQLKQAKSLKGATMPDGSIHP